VFGSTRRINQRGFELLKEQPSPNDKSSVAAPRLAARLYGRSQCAHSSVRYPYIACANYKLQRKR
jgi:hypothetical protein